MPNSQFSGDSPSLCLLPWYPSRLELPFTLKSEHPDVDDEFYDFPTRNAIPTKAMAREVAEPLSLPFQEDREKSQFSHSLK